MRGFSVYFLRNTKPGDKIDQNVVSDNQVLFAETSNNTEKGYLKTLNGNACSPLLTVMART